MFEDYRKPTVYYGMLGFFLKSTRLEENICFCSSWNITPLTVNTIQIDSILKSIFCPQGRRQTHPPLKLTTKKYDVVLMIFWWSWAQIFRRIQGTFILTIHMTESLPAFYFITPVAWIWCFSSQNWTCFHFTVNWYRKSINWCIKIVHQRNEHHVLRLYFVHLIQQNSRRLELSVRFFQLKKLTGATCNLCLMVQMTGVQTTNPEDWFDVGQQVIIKSSLQRSFKHFYLKITTVKISKCYKCFTS